MVLLDYSDEVVGNALKMALGIKSVAWKRQQGLAKCMASSAAIQTNGVTMLGELACIILLEDTIAEPSLFPNGNRGMPMVLAHWRDTISTMSDSRSLTAHAALVLRQIDDGRDYLQGPNPSLADINSAAWILETDLESAPSSSVMLTSWCKRMRSLLEIKGSDDLVVDFRDDLAPKSATLQELDGSLGSSLGSLGFSMTGESDTLIYGLLPNGNRIITSPLSHAVTL